MQWAPNSQNNLGKKRTKWKDSYLLFLNFKASIAKKWEKKKKKPSVHQQMNGSVKCDIQI
jgi:hypothetical protein